MPRLRSLLHLDWTYRRRRTTTAVVVLTLLSAGLAWAALPPSLRPDSLLWVPAGAALAYVVLRLNVYGGWGKRFKHTVMDWFGGDVDDAQTWFIALGASAAGLAAVALVQRLLGA